MSATSGKTVIVTGASTGIGRATAERMAKAGFTVFGTSRRSTNEGPANVTMLTCDVTDDESVKSLVSMVLARTGRIDVLVNNAGIGLQGGAEESSISQIQGLFDVNVFGVVRATNAVLPSMRQQRAGRIINISSVLGFLPAPYSAYYSSTKHAIEGYSESLDHELRAFNIRVSVVEPAYTRSVFDQNSLEPDAAMPEYDKARAGVLALIKEVMTTADSPEVVADAVLVAATDGRPKHRYPAGKLARQISVLRRFAPANAFDRSLRKQMRLSA